MSGGIPSVDPDRPGRLRNAVLLVSALPIYQALGHFALGRQDPSFAIWIAALPLLALGAWQLTRTPLASRLLGAVCLTLGVLAATRQGVSAALCFFVLQVTVCCAIFWLFAGSLRRGRDPLVTTIALSVHGSLPPEIERYTRRVTWYWSIVVASLALTSTALYLFASLSAWSWFANVLTAPLLGSAFAAEYLWRIVRYPRFSHASIVTSLGAFGRVSRGGRNGLRG
jgi:uncharacterized membrane protein